MEGANKHKAELTMAKGRHELPTTKQEKYEKTKEKMERSVLMPVQTYSPTQEVKKKKIKNNCKLCRLYLLSLF